MNIDTQKVNTRERGLRQLVIGERVLRFYSLVLLIERSCPPYVKKILKSRVFFGLFGQFLLPRKIEPEILRSIRFDALDVNCFYFFRFPVF